MVTIFVLLHKSLVLVIANNVCTEHKVVHYFKQLSLVSASGALRGWSECLQTEPPCASRWGKGIFGPVGSRVFQAGA